MSIGSYLRDYEDPPKEIIYVSKYVSRPNTIGNRVGDYIARIIDGSVDKIDRLSRKIRGD